ncbi:MAG TPA: serine/threonine-protein kinase [Oligoflexia bacterium]|nr:serine/threonine-protein kinase [Oligoflexia bacterium]HMP48232.1 serine/threonine-protein kinase [Oligoflexia bacterium]
MLTPPKHTLFKSGEFIAGRYEVIRTLGHGAMGVVVHVLDHALDKEPIALKILHPEVAKDEIQFSRFRNEVLLARTLLSHPNIVRIFDFGQGAAGIYFLSMEYVGGGSLAQRIYVRDSALRLDLVSIIQHLLSICDGLYAAHQRGVIHRDLKPDNILLSEDGTAKITDFGLGRAMNSNQHFTMTGETVGTPFYMSPEQLAGESPDGRCDIYSLGIMAFEMIMKKRPFNSENYLELAHMHMVSKVPEMHSDIIEIPKWFNDFVRICTEKEREDRFKTAADAAEFIITNLGEEHLREGHGVSVRRPFRLFSDSDSSTNASSHMH